MKRFMLFIVTVLVLVFATATVFAAATSAPKVEKKAVTKIETMKTEAPEKEIVFEKMVIVKSSPAVTTIKIQDPESESASIPVKGDKTYEYNIFEQVNGKVIDMVTGEEIGQVMVQKDKKVVQTNSAQGVVDIDFNDNNRPCVKEEKETWAKILLGDENKKTRLNVRFQLMVGVRTTDDLSDTKNGIRTSEKGDDLALFEYSGQININNNIGLQVIRNVGFRLQDVQVMGMSLGGLSIAETTVLMKWYPGEVFGMNPYFGLGGRWIHIDGGYSMGGIPVETSRDGVIIGTRFGIEAPVTSKWAIDIWGEYFKSKIIASLPQAGDSSTETTWRAGLGVVRYF